MATLESIAGFLEHSLLPQNAREAEKQLKSIESTQGFPVTLLHVISSTSLNISVRLAGAVFFKNLVRRKWSNEEGEHLFAEDDVNYIKLEIVNIMIKLPSNLQTQLGESISIIAELDFPHKWSGLIDELVNKLSLTDFIANKAILIVAHSIFKKWRPLFRSDELFLEIKHVLDKFATPFLSLLEKVDQEIDIANSKQDSALLQLYLDVLLVLIQIYYDLNCQDIPEFFEDNMKFGMSIMHKYLTFSSNLITDPSEDHEIDILIKVKTSVIELISLYVTRYAEIFEPLIENFIHTIWNLLIGSYITKQQKFDLCVVKSLLFLTSVINMSNFATLFNSEASIKEIIEKIILPNIYFREIDEETFEDEPIQYVRGDLEGSDFDTRRKSATDFLRELKDINSELVTNTVMVYVDQFLAKGTSDWKDKDVALYLFGALAAKGSVTNVGITSTNVLVDVVKFFSDNVATDLMNTSNLHPILKTDAIKYIFTFRNQLTKAQLLETFPMLFSHLQDSNQVVHTYTAITIEKLLSMTSFTENHLPVFNKHDIQPFAQDLLTHLFQLVLKQSHSPEKLSENELLIKCIMRVLITAEEGTLNPSFSVSLIEQILKILSIILSNPSNPKFSHYIFESLGLLIKYSSPADIANVIALIMPSLLEILGNDVQEFVPYTFQILAFMLELYPSQQPMLENYNQLVKPLLSPSVWEFRGNIPGVTRLLIAIIKQDAQIFVTQNQITPLLGVFQKLLSSKVNDVYGFDLIQEILLNFPLPVLETHLKQIGILLLTRLKSSRTDKYVKKFVIFIFNLACVPLNQDLFHSTQGLINSEFIMKFIDNVQPGSGLFQQIFSSFILPTTATFSNLQDRKIANIGLLQIIQYQTGDNLKLALGQLLTNLSGLSGLTKETSASIAGSTSSGNGGSIAINTVNEFDLELSVFGSQFSKIISIQAPTFDPIPEIKNNDQHTIKQAIASNIRKLGNPEVLGQLTEANMQVLRELGF